MVERDAAATCHNMRQTTNEWGRLTTTDWPMRRRSGTLAWCSLQGAKGQQRVLAWWNTPGRRRAPRRRPTRPCARSRRAPSGRTARASAGRAARRTRATPPGTALRRRRCPAHAKTGTTPSAVCTRVVLSSGKPLCGVLVDLSASRGTTPLSSAQGVML